QTDNSWGPRAIGDHGAPVSLPKLKNAYEKGNRGISWGPLLTPSPRAVPEFPNGQSAPASTKCLGLHHCCDYHEGFPCPYIGFLGLNTCCACYKGSPPAL
ncbi:unnamed protein product, partial [Staurois parvus]